MNTTSIFSENSRVEAGIYIKGDFKKQKSQKYDMSAAAGQSNFKTEKAVVRQFSKTPATEQYVAGKHTYTIRQGDEKRLGKNGVLRVYNIKEPIDIPVSKLLGRWKTSHIGVTVFVANGQWRVEGEAFDHTINKPETKVVIALRSLLKFALA